MESRILGPLEVVDRGSAVPLGGPKQRALLSVLLLTPNLYAPTEPGGGESRLLPQ